MKIFKNIVIVTGAITVALSIFYLVTLSGMEFNFANEGKIICVTRKDFGMFGKRDLNCFNISPVGQEQEIQKYKCETLNGEIVIKK